MTERRTITLREPDGPGIVVLEYWPENGCWYEAGRPDEIGALYAPAYEDGTDPTWDEVCEISDHYADAMGWPCAKCATRDA